jgi:RHS repeat-associated protein
MAGTNEMQFASMPRHANSGLSLFTFRGYDPSFQRWIQRDPLEELADINLYRGMLNSPLDVLDPNGLLPGAENAPVAFPASMALPQTPVSTPLPTIGPMTQAIIPYPGPAQLPNPFTYDALLIGANHLVDTPIGYELAKGNALNYLTAPGTQMAVGGLLGKLSPLLKNLKPCPAASFPTKAAAREALKQMGLPEGQLAKALSAVTKATSGSTIGVSQNGEDLIVSITRPGFNGYQEMQYTISPEGLKTVVQRAFDSAGNIVHYDPKNP